MRAPSWLGIVVALGRLMGRGFHGAHGWLLWTSIAVTAGVSVGMFAAWRRIIDRPLPRALLWGGAGAALAVAAAAILLRVVGLDAARSVTASVDPRLVPVVLAVQVASTAALTQVYRATYASQTDAWVSVTRSRCASARSASPNCCPAGALRAGCSSSNDCGDTAPTRRGP